MFVHPTLNDLVTLLGSMDKEITTSSWVEKYLTGYSQQCMYDGEAVKMQLFSIYLYKFVVIDQACVSTLSIDMCIPEHVRLRS